MYCCNDESKHKHIGVVWMKDDIKECPLCRMTVLLKEALEEIERLRNDLSERNEIEDGYI